MLTTYFNILTLSTLSMQKVIRNLIEEEDSSELLADFIAVHSQKDKNRLAEIQDVFPTKTNTSDSLDKHVIKHTCT